MERVLIVDDDEGLVYFLRRFFSREGLDVCTCGSGTAAVETVSAQPFDLILLDYKMPGLNGLDTLKEIRRRQVKTPIIVMTAYGTMETAIEAMRLGAYDYLLKPFDRQELQRLSRDALEVNRLMKEVVDICEPGATPSASSEGSPARIVGSNRRMQEIFKLIGQVADKDVTILITGESGTGKELIARAIYHHSHRKERPLLAVNCAAIPETLFESELFGHERGAFTGADRVHIGRFEACHGGTLFFDEIGDMPLSTQAKILRVIQYGEFERLGGTQKIKTDVRTIAATNKDLEREVAEGRFREDLYWRLKIISIHLPPLRERMEDLPALVEYFRDRFSREYRTTIRHVDSAALERLKSYFWPGNIRELENCMRRAVLLAPGDVILKEHLDIGQDKPGQAQSESPEQLSTRLYRNLEDLIPDLLKVSGTNIHGSIIDTVERVFISKVLSQCGFNQVKAARMLGISRNTLRNRMKKFDIPGAQDGLP
ncbi:MAG: sigma-54 dependent transcriptional regulator [Desulfobacteraceae bacterium]|nr:sigma-54 dependent transcriptional regulator [Desulfobacteraceae bacterium]